MKRLHPFLIFTGAIGALANIVAIASYLSGALPLARWHLSSGLVLAGTFVLLAYSLTIWSSLTWRWARARPGATTAASRRGALFLLDLLLAFPLLVLWAYLLVSALSPASFPIDQRWILGLSLAWIASPFAAFALVAIGEALGPLLGNDSH
jgi:hypothetical protein